MINLRLVGLVGCLLLLLSAGSDAFVSRSIGPPQNEATIGCRFPSTCPNPCSLSSVFRERRICHLSAKTTNLDGSNPRKPSNNIFRRFLRRTSPRPFIRSCLARYSRLSKKLRRVVALQFAILCFVCATLTKNLVTEGSLSGAYRPPPVEVGYSSFMQIVERQKDNAPTMDRVRIGKDRIQYRLHPTEQLDNSKNPISIDLPSLTPKGKLRLLRQQQKRPGPISAYTRKVAAAPELLQHLNSNEIRFSAAPLPPPSPVVTLARFGLFSIYGLFLWRMYQTMAAAGGRKTETMGSVASSSLTDVSFDDIQGMDDAKLQVMELVDTIRNPSQYARLGARAPTGLLLVGPPGTGKTLLARVTAATAGIPLVHCSGSDFVEMFVGRGAARVRSLFERAKKMAPCIIFVDELDALGKSRDGVGNNVGGGGLFQRSNDEAEQTLNQLLACMDGLDRSRRICVLAATNRKEVLDPALVRPGRFDRIVTLELPNSLGRESILRVYTSKLPGFTECRGVSPDRPNSLGKDGCVDLAAVAAVTDGLSGAELEFLVNEAAIRAVRRVNAAAQQGVTVNYPHVEARDMEDSVRSFFATRKPKGVGSVNDMLRGVWKQ